MTKLTFEVPVPLPAGEAQRLIALLQSLQEDQWPPLTAVNDEPKKAEPKPIKDEPKKAEPKKAEPKKSEPKKADAAKLDQAIKEATNLAVEMIKGKRRDVVEAALEAVGADRVGSISDLETAEKFISTVKEAAQQ